MKVALETNALYTTRAGVARYCLGLMRGLPDVLRRGESFQELAWQVENLEYRQPRRALKTAYRELYWAGRAAPLELRHEGFDLLHSTNTWLVDPPPHMPVVATLHDLALMRHPERFRRWHRVSGLRRLRALKLASKVICVSRFTADEAMALLELPAAKLEVVHNGCDFATEELIPAEEPATDLPGEYLLFVGSLEPGKNLALLREVYACAEAAGSPLPPLVIAGSRWEGVRAEGPSPADWRFLGHVSDGELVHLYRRAAAFLFPTKYEGFGLPLAEAMALGCPVVCGRVASLPEVGGDAAYYADALEPEAFLKAIRRLLEDPAEAASRAEAGKKHAKTFTWRACAEGTAAIYRELC